ncbi:hypothetical protein ACQ4PT_019202 [Festuca glaucescens]
MADAHEGWAVAMVDPPPPENLLQHTMDQVRNFLLDRDLEIVNSLPWFCGVGAFQFRNLVLRAALVDHGVWPLGDATLRFIKHNEGQGFRTQHGARTGWLMFIGTPMDFRNTETIAEAINTFGEFHYWQHRDIQKCRILVYATFRSPDQVPRDDVFRQPKVARFSGLRHSWTAPVYILSTEHAGVHPADEDPMPLDGNPHLLPGNLQPDNLNFVLPEYPEVGWNVPPVDAMPDVIPPVVNQPAQHEPDGLWEQHVQGSDANSAVSSASIFGNAPPVVQVMAAEPLEPQDPLISEELPAVHVLVEEEAGPAGPVVEEAVAVVNQEVLGDQVMVDNEVADQVVQVFPVEVEVFPPAVVAANVGPDDVVPVAAVPEVAVVHLENEDVDLDVAVVDHVVMPSSSLAVVPFVAKRSVRDFLSAPNRTELFELPLSQQAFQDLMDLEGILSQFQLQVGVADEWNTIW